MNDDNRKYIRFEIPLSVAFNSQGSAAQKEGMTSNFSREGLCLSSCDFDFQPNSVIELKLQVPNQDDSLTVSGEIVWRKKVGDTWQVGIKFKDIDRAGKVDVLECAYKAWLDKVRSEKK